ncbi:MULTISPECIES: ABC transporter permease [unclassified Halanaerobium]|uniref:ABC transporter permease n=1 Tax=unclassified Halanaerobium TaxID=2641197 RepID=UPI000DF153F3|nr:MULTISPECIES: ABC transporter permease [unclassified Halanaerobium]RCW49719.1 peptide/nickel transport system permease protein [Halanaerobium sp. MA284_MarDTE_T2]RCW88404.1 peptide/nickel transport system permease protein [Halanaerobium sp. DL-01]
MFIYITKRFLWVIPTILTVLLLLFSLSYLLPGDPADIILGPRATPEMAEELESRLGLDKPWYQSYLIYLQNIIKGDLGTSIFRDRSVLKVILDVLPYTVILTLAGMGLAVFNGISIGLLAANYNNSYFEKFLTMLSFITASTPTYIAGVLLIVVFSVNFNLLPSIGIGDGGLLDSIHHLIGPALALSVGWTGYIARLTRSSMLETLDQEFIQTEKSFGIPRYYILYKYALKKAIKPIIAVIGLGIGRLLGGAVFVEVIFNRPGLGRLIVDSVNERDLPLVRGGVLVAALLFVIANLVADISYAYFDPRIKQK